MLTPASPELIIATVTHPRNWKWIVEDGISPETYVPPTQNRLYLAHGDQGFIAVERLGRYTWAFHIAMLPGARKVAEFAQQVMDALALIFDAKKFIGSTPADNKAACRLARACGAVEEGRFKEAFYRDGKMQDVILHGITRT